MVDITAFVTMFCFFKVNLSRNTVVKTIIALVACFLALVIPSSLLSVEDAVYYIRLYGYWSISLIVLFSLISFIRVCKMINGSRIRWFVSQNVWGLVAISFAWFFINFHVDKKFRVANDEYMLSTVAKTMYSDGKTYSPSVVHYYEGQVFSKVGIVGKRPILFQYLLSLIHTVTGFRPENVFWLNSFLALILLVMIYCLTLCVGNRSMGILAVLLIASLPLFAENANGGGYEVLNLCLISMLCLSSIYYLRCPGSSGLNLMVCISVLLANCRYESILYVLVPAILYLVKSIRNKQFMLTWFVAFSPLILILPLLSYSVFQGYESFFQTSRENFFSFSHLPDNLWYAFQYLFHFGTDYSNSLLVSFGGFAGGCYLFINFLANPQNFFNKRGSFISLSVVFSITVYNTFLALSCWWGGWIDPLTSRFSLPLHFWGVLITSFALKKLLSIKPVAACIFSCCILYIATVTSHNNKKINNEQRFMASTATDLGISWFLENVKQKENLVISPQGFVFDLYDYATIPPLVAVSFPERVMLMKDLGVYKDIYIFDIFSPVIVNKDLSRYSKELVFRHAFSDFIYIEISQVTGLKPAAEGEATLPENLPPDKPDNLDDREVIIDYLRRICPLVPNMEVESFQKP